MNDELEFDPDLDLDEEADLASPGEGEFIPIEDDDDWVNVVSTRTAIMKKNDMVALLCLKTGIVGAAICRVDPREAVPAVQLYKDAGVAADSFDRDLNTSISRGWSVVYDGLPLHG